MKIRVMGTKDECEQARSFYAAFKDCKEVRSFSVSGLYPNRNSFNQYRVYVDIEYYGSAPRVDVRLLED